MFRLATIDGARVWHLENEIGTLTPGKEADIVIIDIRSPHLDGFGDPVAVMVLGAGSADVETVIVGATSSSAGASLRATMPRKPSN
jgi:cytosine/adenosine deaminase-related metal-dependent hydrolase